LDRLSSEPKETRDEPAGSRTRGELRNSVSEREKCVDSKPSEHKRGTLPIRGRGYPRLLPRGGKNEMETRRP